MMAKLIRKERQLMNTVLKVLISIILTFQCFVLTVQAETVSEDITTAEEKDIPCYMVDFSTNANSNQVSEDVLNSDLVQSYNWNNTYIYFGSYEQDNDVLTKEEPILWRVINREDNSLILVSDKALDMKPFHKENEAVSWEDCSLRAWLNGYEDNPWKDSFLYNAFNKEEQAYLQKDALGDCVSLLSIEDINLYTKGESRISINTEYTRKLGAIDYNGYSLWWTRPLTGKANKVSLCGCDVDNVGMQVNQTNYAVRPVIRIDLSEVLFVSAVEKGKALYVPDSEMVIVDRNIENIYKLTLRGDAQTLEVDVPEEMEVEQGQVITLPYSKASTGYHNYISAIITFDNKKENVGDNIAYYGKLQQGRAEEGVFSVRIPTDISAGEYQLKLFMEECQAKEEQDYGSDFQIVKITVPKYTGGFTIQEVEPQTYTGEEIRPEVIVTDNNGRVVDPLEYEVSYNNNIDAGLAEITVSSNELNYDKICNTTKTFPITGKIMPVILTCNAQGGDRVYAGQDFHLIARIEMQEGEEAATGGLMEFYMNGVLLNKEGAPVDYGFAIYEIAGPQLEEYGTKTFYAKYVPAATDIYGENVSEEIVVNYKENQSEDQKRTYLLMGIGGSVLSMLVILLIIMIPKKGLKKRQEG